MPWGHWRRLTLTGALALDGIVAAMSVAAATSTRVFLAFLEQLDRAAIKGAGAEVPAGRHRRDGRPRGASGDGGPSRSRRRRHLPPPARLLPDSWRAALSTLIEAAWSKLKTRLRARAARSINALETELGPALAAITADAAHGWFRHCGYHAQLN